MSDQNDKLKNLKTSSVDRRLSIAKASLLAGTRWATASATSIFSSEEEKEKKRGRKKKEEVEDEEESADNNVVVSKEEQSATLALLKSLASHSVGVKQHDNTAASK